MIYGSMIYCRSLRQTFLPLLPILVPAHYSGLLPPHNSLFQAFGNQLKSSIKMQLEQNTRVSCPSLLKQKFPWTSYCTGTCNQWSAVVDVEGPSRGVQTPSPPPHPPEGVTKKYFGPHLRKKGRISHGSGRENLQIANCDWRSRFMQALSD